MDTRTLFRDLKGCLVKEGADCWEQRKNSFQLFGKRIVRPMTHVQAVKRTTGRSRQHWMSTPHRGSFQTYLHPLLWAGIVNPPSPPLMLYLVGALPITSTLIITFDKPYGFVSRLGNRVICINKG
jgi:hypothetical protein